MPLAAQSPKTGCCRKKDYAAERQFAARTRSTPPRRIFSIVFSARRKGDIKSTELPVSEDTIKKLSSVFVAGLMVMGFSQQLLGPSSGGAINRNSVPKMEP